MTELQWRKSRRSFIESNCVEVAHVGTEVWLRNSRDPDGAVLKFTRAEFAAFVAGAAEGEFDDRD